MADLTADRAKHATLTGTTADKVTLADARGKVRIINRHTTEPLWFTIGGPNVGAPTAAGDNVDVVMPGQTVTVSGHSSGTTVRLLGNANPYSVIGV